ncbi:unnamed protein product [Caenorhabditis bovis]|uniref:Uncharacterized protein n=1 Tax=Caenorhabditis bovis TaxID=2654633 RepID=A0A8S1EAX8_9PELO|nr:unnamed protein product [Caenorhabditis bovis]
MATNFSADIVGRNVKNTCPECLTGTIQKCSTLTGKLGLYGLWWCCIGFLIYKLSLYDYCEFCYQAHFEQKSREKRITQLLMDDKSLYEPPDVDRERLKRKYGIENLVQ